MASPNWQREEIRAELDHLAELRKRVEVAMGRGEIDVESGTAMLLNIHEARAKLLTD
jgi:hypothetical protein